MQPIPLAETIFALLAGSSTGPPPPVIVQLAFGIGIVAAVAWASLLVVGMAWQKRRIRRLRRGHCIRCGYDLRASTTRCPECGTPDPGAQNMQH